MRFKLALQMSFMMLAVLTAAAPQPGQKNGTTIPLAKGSGFKNPDGTIDIDALESHIASAQDKILRGFENFEKNTGAPHPSAPKEIQKRGTAAVPLTVFKKQQWYGAISVGWPSSTSFTVNFDTGSGHVFVIQRHDLVLPGPNCDSSCAGHTIYNPSSSSTSQDLGLPFSLTYGDGSTASGEQYADTVVIAGLTAVNQVLGVASQYSSGLQVSRWPADGLLGMGFPSIAAFSTSPVVQSLISKSQLDQPVFSFKFSASGGEVYFGGVDSALYTGDFTYVNVMVPGYWLLNMDSIQANDAIILEDIDCIIDTATSAIIGFPNDVAQIYETLGGTPASKPGLYTFPCDSFPDISLSFGGTPFPISTATLNLGRVSGTSDCVSGIVAGGQGVGSSFWMIGDVFLQNVYTTFDVGNVRVGFAQLA